MKTYYQRRFYLPSSYQHQHHQHRQHDSNANYLSSSPSSSNHSYWHRGSIQLKRWLGRSSTAMTDGICSGFEPQNYLRDRCKKCFRLKSKHDEQNNNNNAASTTTSTTPLTNGRSRRPVSVASAIGQPIPDSGTPTSTTMAASGAVATAILAKKEKRKSWRDRNHQSPDEGPDNEVPDTSDTISQASFKSAYSKGMSSAKSLESITSINDTKSMITACSGDSFGNENDVDDDERALTPTESECTNDHLKSHLRRLKEENTKLKEEKQRLTSKHNPKDGKEMTLVQELQERLAEAENIIQDYRDENTVLKCELRDINAPLTNGNANNHGIGNTDIDYKLKETENLCEELMIENENLKSDIRDLQQEIEEMQDQYREEEIEEFRELQRELEQNAKNCRVLQFKLRKAERQRDSAETERDHVQGKLKEFSKGGDPSALDYTRQKELESELRIAKEVSVRLHNELEAAEEKRCKLEDEVFYYKEKCRELQTQNKWRETRNKADQAAKRHSQEIVEAVDLPTDELRKELRDVLERENDLREQLRFTEEDLKRSRSKLTEMENENEDLLQKLVRLTESTGRTGQRRPPITRSASEGQTELQLELAATELDQLQTKCDNLEKKNLTLTKKMLEMEIDLVKKLQDKSGENGYQLNAELEKDLGRLMSTIYELEKKNSELTLQLKKQSTTELSGSLKVASAPNSPIIGKEKSLQVELRNEQEKRKELEIEIAEYKSLIAKSDNQKLIAMATKVELLQNQLLLANDRCNALHKKAIKESTTDATKYADSLKQKCEALEKQLSEEKSAKIYEKVKKVENHDTTSPTSDEIEHCCVVLASIEAQTNRLAKQVDKIDSNGQKDQQRRRSLTLDNSAVIVGELANVLSELKGIKDILHNYKVSNPNYIRESPQRDSVATTTPKICEQCEENLKIIDSMKDEITFYKKKNKELTNQVLQTEDRWSREIEKQTHGYRSQIHALDTNLGEVQKKLDEQIHLTESINAQLSEKKRTLEEERARIIKFQIDLEEKQKALQNLEKEQHILREWEIKYKKLEKLFDQEKSKFDADRLRIKSDTAVLKKRTDEAVADLEKLRNSHQRREIMWNEERQRLEKEMTELREKIGNKKDSNDDEGVIIPVQTLNYKVARINGESVPELKAKLSAADKKIDELETKIVDLRISKEELESEALRKKISFEREKDTLLHKVRQDDKVKVVEIDALQQKFASRMSIMENTNKSLHSQLVQTRRERDHHREAVANYEARLEKEQLIITDQIKKIHDSSQKASQAEKRVQELEAEIHRLTVELSFSKDAHKADKKLWIIEKNHYNKGSTLTDNEDRRITEDALKAAESVQKQYAEYQKLYASEVDRLNKKVKEAQSEMAHKQFETEKYVKELREQIKMLEIDQKNLMQAKEMQTNAREVLQADQERLLQIVQQAEVKTLTRKYKIAAITDQLYGLPDKAKVENDGVVSSVISQLNAIREEDSQNVFTSNDISGGDMDYTQDLISQSSISVKSTPYQTSRLASRQTNPSSYSLGMPIPKDRSYSIDSNSTWAYDISERRSSPSRRPYPDPPPSFLPSKDRVPEYDKDGRLHYIPKSIARSTSYDRYGNSLSTDAPPTSMSLSSAQIQTRSTGTWTEENAEIDESMASRTGNAGTNILYKIRREELSKGTTPSVRSIAKAFESMDPRHLKRGLFSIRKSRSVDTSEQARQSKHNVVGNSSTLRPVTPLNRNTTSMSQIELGGDRPGFHNAPPIGPNLAHCTLPRNRNPFKNMGAKIVDRVRRSLSRSRRPSEEKLNITDIENSQMLPPIPSSTMTPSSSYPSSSYTEATTATTTTMSNEKGGKSSSKKSSDIKSSASSTSTNNTKQTKKTVAVKKKASAAVP